MILYSYPKYTIQKFILLILLVIYIPNLSTAQSSIKFELNDSLEININDLGSAHLFEYGYRTKRFNEYLFIYPLYQDSIFKFNLKTKQVSGIKLEKNNKRNHFLISRIDVSKNMISAVNNEGTKINQYTWEGGLLNSIKPKLFWSKSFASIPQNIEYDPIHDVIYLAIRSKFRESFIVKKKKKVKKYYARTGLIGAFNSKGKLLAKLGQYDSLYQSNFYLYADRYSFRLNDKNELLLSQELSPKVEVFSVQPEESSTEYIFKAKHIKKDFSEIQKVTFVQSREEYNTAVIESFHYFSVNQINNENLYYRYYKPSSKDTTGILEVLEDDLVNGKFCKPLSEKEINQKEILRNMPIYLQVINLKDQKIIYDDLTPFIGWFISNNGDNDINFVWIMEASPKNIKLYQHTFDIRK